ncbi:MAG: GNAT family N-acetyltransferase [candidate division Zixibacteria bacterium]|nr:GNAT family N-acetyltransferase [candidate division Zixibacteria bacterium]
MLKLIYVETEEHINTIRKLFREYEDFLGFHLCFQNFEEEMKTLPGKYAPPEGRLIIAEYDSEIAGCVAVKKIGEGVCEMKRLYVRPEFRGKKIGRKLAERIIEDAGAIGYDIMRLDTLERLKEAIALYRSMGFKETTAYVYNPIEDVVYMELKLSS